MRTPREPMSGSRSGLAVTTPSERKSMASSSEWMPKRRRSSAVMLVDVAGAAVPVSSDFDAVVTMFSSSNACTSEPVSSVARAVALERRPKGATKASPRLARIVIRTPSSA
jgi:hypothetical protein